MCIKVDLHVPGVFKYRGLMLMICVSACYAHHHLLCVFVCMLQASVLFVLLCSRSQMNCPLILNELESTFRG